jgi:hypothetical protein
MRMIGIAIPTSMAVLAMGSGAAWAATCDTSYVDSSCGSTCQSLYGSDTMTQIIKDSIKGSKACITYVNTGSGQGEKNITGVGQNYNQGLAPMSRNFTPSFLTGAAAAYNPTPDNVLCLDAGVNAVGNINGHIQNLPCSATSGNNACDATCDINVNPLEIALGGYPASCRGSGTWAKSGATTAECADPQRVAAIAKLTALQGARIDHFFRRDDKSGTQDTFRERLQFDRWCNGKSEGNTNAQWSNLKNYDLDPVRRTCTNEHSDTTHARTHCTYYPLNIPAANGSSEADTCFNGDVLASTDSRNPYGVDIPCTQGWVVALSETDTGHTDITISIGQRIAADFNGQTMGGGGLAVTNTGSVGVTLNTVSFEDFNVRGGHYAMWRRLFLQRNPNALSSAYITAAQDAQEQKLWSWASKRANLCSICSNDGFYPPIVGCGQTCDDPNNQTCLTAEAGLGTPKMNIGAETQAKDPSYPCVADGTTGSSGNCASIPAVGAGSACNVNGTAKCSGGKSCTYAATGSVCQ